MARNTHRATVRSGGDRRDPAAPSRDPARAEGVDVSSRTGRPTLATIAQAAGVSVATVSKVLNGREDVAPATRALVQDLLQRHYYVGRGQETRHPTIELIFHGPLSAYSTEVIEGVLDAAMQSDVAVVLSKRLESGENAEPSATAWALGLAAAGRQAVISVC